MGPFRFAQPSTARAWRGLVVFVVSVSYLAYIFRPFQPAFWNTGLGDWMDPYFINYLLEHWYRSLSRFSDPASPPMYFPVGHTLGYSHGLVLFAPFYVPMRLFLHPFQAYSLALFAVMETGILCLYALLRRRFQLTFLEALLLTAFFFTSTNVVNGTVSVWSQRASVFLIPPILCIGAASFGARHRGARIVGGALTGCLATLLYTHDFYTAHFAWFFVVLAVFAFARTSMAAQLSGFWAALGRPERVALIAGILALLWTSFVMAWGGAELHVRGLRITSHNWRRPACLAGLSVVALLALRGPRWIRTNVGRIDRWWRAFAGGAAVGSAVFLWIYLPVIREQRAFPEIQVLNALTARDLWHAYSSLRSFVVVFGLSLVLFVPWSRSDSRSRRASVWLIAASAIVLLIPMRDGNLSIWMAAFRWAPGFSVIRDPTRVIYVYELAAVLAAAWLLTRLPRTTVFRVTVAIVLTVLIAADHNRDIFEGYRPRAVFHRWVEAPIVIDPACQSFFIKGASAEYMSRSSHMWTLYAIDAMFVSLNHSLPTLNGYSAWSPEGWNLWNPQEADYPDRVRTWIDRHHLTGVCEFDIEARTMSPLRGSGVSRQVSDVRYQASGVRHQVSGVRERLLPVTFCDIGESLPHDE